MNINDAFPSKYLAAAADIPEDADLILTRREVITEEVGQGEQAEQKPVLYFDGSKKGLVLNKTNAASIVSLYGPNTDTWLGKRIALLATAVTSMAPSDAMSLRPSSRRRLAWSSARGGCATAFPLTATITATVARTPAGFTASSPLRRKAGRPESAPSLPRVRRPAIRT